MRGTINDFYIVEKTKTYPVKSSRKVEENVRFSGMHLHIKENYFETAVLLEENQIIDRY
jgi:hypothetical protein